jgi:hypothetical protein
VGAAGFGAVANTVLRRQSDQPAAVAMHSATHAVFVGLLLAGLLTAAILVIVPRRFPSHAAAEAQSAT